MDKSDELWLAKGAATGLSHVTAWESTSQKSGAKGAIPVQFDLLIDATGVRSTCGIAAHFHLPEGRTPQWHFIRQIADDPCRLNVQLDLIITLSHAACTTGKTELYVGHNNFRRLEGKPMEIT
jgi:hypothetical protein